MIFGAILAGGTGTRMRSELPKQFMLIAGKPIIIYSIETFLKCEGIDKLVLGIHPDWISYCHDLLQEYLPKYADSITIAPGGSDRNATLMNVIKAIEDEYGDSNDHTIITHDAARPLVSKRIIEDHISALGTYVAANTVIPVTDTIIVSEDGQTVSGTINRDTLYRVQTPQSFKINALKENFAKLRQDQKEILTDACGIFTLNNKPVYLIRGEEANIKVTTPEDIAIAENLLK